MEKKKYPICPEDYKLFEEIGHGVSARVYRALCIPLNEIVAIKVLDLEKVNNDLANISREAQTMILIDHPNVLKAHCSFVNDHNLWVVTPFMAGGSCLHILKAAYPDGFGEAVIATILREVLKGLEYLHHHGHIHRDVKAGNILVDASGAVKLGDFGVSACLFDSGDRQRMRNTFVGTPCWMAPEVMEQLHGYDFKADIWSFGITALELAHGHAPFSKYPPMKVLLMTLQNAPPGLDYERDRKFSKSFKQMIAMCLVKDPSKRPSSSKLLKHPFFRQARSNDYIARTIIEGLPTLVDRLKALKEKEADMLAQKKMPDGEKEEISQNEYKRGISGWNFDIEDLKAQASLIQDVEALLCKEQGESSSDSSLFSIDCSPEKQPRSLAPIMENDVAYKESENVTRVRPAPLPLPGRTVNAPKGKVDNFADQRSAVGPTDDSNILQSMPFKLQYHSNGNENKLDEKFELEVDQKQPDHIPSPSYHRRVASDSTELLHPARGTSDKQQSQPQRMANGTAASLAVSDPSSDNSARTSSNCDDPDEKSKAPVIQQKGRFKVTSESVEKALLPSPVLQKSHSMQVFAQPSVVSLPLPLDATSNLLGSSLFPQLHSILQTNILQRDNILNLMKQVTIGETSSANRISNAGSIPTATIVTEKSLLEAANEREKELLQEITDLQWRLVCVTDELQRVKTKNAQV